MSKPTFVKVEAHDEAILKMFALPPSRRAKLLAQLEHAVMVDSNTGWPVYWFAPRGTKVRGSSNHWVSVAVGQPLVCTCGQMLYPGPQCERYVLEDIVGHFTGEAGEAR